MKEKPPYQHFQAPSVSEEFAPTTIEELTVAGKTPENLTILKKKAIASAKLAPNINIFAFRKARSYSIAPWLDCMLFVARDKEPVGSIAELSSNQLTQLLALGTKVLDSYKETADPTDPVSLEALSVNYHEEPLRGGEAELFNRKLHAQTLDDLHLHAVAFRSSDLAIMEPFKKIDGESKNERSSSISSDQLMELHDPLIRRVEELILTSPIQRAQFTDGFSVLTLSDQSPYRGINFTIPLDMLSDPALAADLQLLHKRSRILYESLADLFVDRTQLDATNMPTLLGSSESLQRIQQFIADNYPNAKDSVARKQLERYLTRLQHKLFSGEAIAGLPADTQRHTRIFLRNFGYTLSVISRPNEDHATVTLSPRLLSIGNLMTTLGWYKNLSGNVVPHNTLEQHRVERSIQDHFSEI